MEKVKNNKKSKKIEEAKKEQRRLRREMLEALKNYWKDVAAMERVAKLTDNKQILFNGDLIAEEKNKLYNNYSILQGLTISQISILRTLIHNDEERDEYSIGSKYGRMNELLPDEAIWLDDSFDSEEDLLEQIELLKRIGITKIYYTNKSTLALSNMIWLYRAGTKIIGTTNINKHNEGIVIEL